MPGACINCSMPSPRKLRASLNADPFNAWKAIGWLFVFCCEANLEIVEVSLASFSNEA